MNCLTELSLRWEEAPGPLTWNDWDEAVRSCIETMPNVGTEGFDRENAWVIAGWAEKAASQSVRLSDTSLVAVSLAALAIVSESDAMDLRDLLVVAGIVRRAAELLGADACSIIELARTLPRIGSIDNPVLDWFAKDIRTRNLGHVEVGNGHTFEFKRVPLADVERIQRMREAGGPTD